ncbi:hypothetical protein BT69DRAFT_1322301 [Atractiella rhizophila]|nr:hypothetical protein BT69DRAFT_1322301 [Atractiella rhizophila]
MVRSYYPTISLHVPYSGAYLHPSTDPDQPSPDTVFKGKCTLTLPKARTMPEIVITLKGYGKVAMENLIEEWMTIEKEVCLPKSSEVLAAGEHVFEFSFIIPASSSPYDRGQYGRVYQKLSAIVKGVGVLGSNISCDKPLYFVVNPTPENSTPAGLGLEVQDLHSDVGPYMVSATSRNMMVSGIIVLGFSLAAPPSKLHIYSVTWSIVQSYHLRFPKSGREYNSPPQKRVIWRERKDQQSVAPHLREPYKTLEPGEEFILMEKKRLPNDNHIRSSTFPGTETPINVRHHILFECYYAVDGQERKVLQVQRPVDISSCCIVLDDSVLLPEYREDEEALPLEDACLCLLDERAMAKRYRHDVEPVMHDMGASPQAMPKYEYECLPLEAGAA